MAVVDGDPTTDEDAICGASAGARWMYRGVKRFPPDKRDYVTAADRGYEPDEDATPEEIASLSALSAWETVTYAEQFARTALSLKYVVRYCVPERGADVRWVRSGGPSHYDIQCDNWSDLHLLLDQDFKVRVRHSKGEEER